MASADRRLQAPTRAVDITGVVQKSAQPDESGGGELRMAGLDDLEVGSLRCLDLAFTREQKSQVISGFDTVLGMPGRGNLFQLPPSLRAAPGAHQQQSQPQGRQRRVIGVPGLDDLLEGLPCPGGFTHPGQKQAELGLGRRGVLVMIGSDS